MFNRNPYEVLGVAPGAGAQELKLAYRRLAVHLHPDHNPGNAHAEDRFKELQAAYDLLCDPARRAAFDARGTPLRTLVDPLRRTRPEAGMKSPPQVGPDIPGTMEVDLREVALGAQVGFAVVQRSLCIRCAGQGQMGGRRRICRTCGSRGKVRVAPGRGGLQICGTCAGLGKVRSPCVPCGGSGAFSRQVRLVFVVPPGMADGFQVRYPGQGEPGWAGGSPGDLLLTVRIRPHAWLEREGYDLVANLPLTVGEAIRGGTVELPTFNGLVELAVPPRVCPGTRLRLRGLGMKRPDGSRGALFVRVHVALPPQASDEVLRGAELVDRGYSRSPRADLRA